IKLTDFCVVLVAALICYGGYLAALTDGSDGIDRYGLTALLGAILFIIGFQRIRGYEFKKLTSMRWQATRVAVVWGAAVAAMLLLAFVGKVSSTYSRGWALSWVTMTFGLLLIERSLLHLSIMRWTRQGRLLRNVVIVGAGAP